MVTGKPPLAAWIVRERERKGWKSHELARRLREAGFEAEDSTVRTWEGRNARPPKSDTVRALERLFGTAAPNGDTTALGDVPELVAAIRDLVEEMRLARQEQAEWNRGVQDVLAAIGARVRAAPTGDLEPVPRAGAPR